MKALTATPTVHRQTANSLLFDHSGKVCSSVRTTKRMVLLTCTIACMVYDAATAAFHKWHCCHHIAQHASSNLGSCKTCALQPQIRMCAMYAYDVMVA
jgi:hypothetical protein